MWEDYLEALDKMFPDGYVIVYTTPGNTIRLGLYNPIGLIELEEANEHLLKLWRWEEGGDIKL